MGRVLCLLGIHTEGPDSYSRFDRGRPLFVRICGRCGGMYHAQHWS